jgi:hypothetical protein
MFLTSYSWMASDPIPVAWAASTMHCIAQVATAGE